MTWRVSSCDRVVGLSWTSLKPCRSTSCMATAGFTELQSPVIDTTVNTIINKTLQVLIATVHKTSSSKKFPHSYGKQVLDPFIEQNREPDESDPITSACVRTVYGLNFVLLFTFGSPFWSLLFRFSVRSCVAFSYLPRLQDASPYLVVLFYHATTIWRLRSHEVPY